MILTPGAVSTQHVSYDLYTLETRCWPWLGGLSTHLFSYIFWQSRDSNERCLVERGLFCWLPIVHFAYGCFQQTDWAMLAHVSISRHFALLIATTLDFLYWRIWEVLVCRLVLFGANLAWDQKAMDTKVYGSIENTCSGIQWLQQPHRWETAVLLNRILGIFWQWHCKWPHLLRTSEWISCWRTSLTFFLSSSFP